MKDYLKSKRIRKHLSRYVQILLRCYDKNCKSYKNYGAKGVKMCEEWLNSPDAFINWCENNGYSEDKVLDKDILCDKLNINPKIYSPETCMFITKEENQQYCFDNTTYKSIACYNLDGNFVAVYKSIADASRKASISKNYIPNIGRAANGKRLTCCNLYWRYVDSVNNYPLKIEIVPKKNNFKKVSEVSISGEVIKTYKNLKDAAKDTGILSSSISSVSSGHRNSVFGRYFKYLDT